MVRAIVVGLAVLVWAAPVVARSCEDTAAKMTAAFVRRLARDTGNSIGRYGVELSLATDMTLGVPSATAAARVQAQLERLWIHTENKIHRKCSDAEAAARWPGDGQTTAAVTDDLFNQFGLPWVSALRNLTAPHGAACAQVAIVQAGYAARDRIRFGAYNWERYATLVDRVCPAYVFVDIEEASELHLLGALDVLRLPP